MAPPQWNFQAKCLYFIAVSLFVITLVLTFLWIYLDVAWNQLDTRDIQIGEPEPIHEINKEAFPKMTHQVNYELDGDAIGVRLFYNDTTGAEAEGGYMSKQLDNQSIYAVLLGVHSFITGAMSAACFSAAYDAAHDHEKEYTYVPKSQCAFICLGMLLIFLAGIFGNSNELPVGLIMAIVGILIVISGAVMFHRKWRKGVCSICGRKTEGMPSPCPCTNLQQVDQNAESLRPDGDEQVTLDSIPDHWVQDASNQPAPGLHPDGEYMHALDLDRLIPNTPVEPAPLLRQDADWSYAAKPVPRVLTEASDRDSTAAKRYVRRRLPCLRDIIASMSEARKHSKKE